MTHPVVAIPRREPNDLSMLFRNHHHEVAVCRVYWGLIASRTGRRLFLRICGSTHPLVSTVCRTWRKLGPLNTQHRLKIHKIAKFYLLDVKGVLGGPLDFHLFPARLDDTGEFGAWWPRRRKAVDSLAAKPNSLETPSMLSKSADPPDSSILGIRVSRGTALLPAFHFAEGAVHISPWEFPKPT